MKLLAVTSHDILSDSSGTPIHILKILSALALRGFQVSVLYLKSDLNLFSNVQHHHKNGLDIYQVPVRYWFSFSRKLVIETDLKTCIAFTNGAASRFLPVLYTLNLPLVYEVHTVFRDSSITSPVSFIYEQLEKIVCRYTNHLVVLGEQVKELYTSRRDIKKDSISIIYPSVNINEFETVTQPGNRHDKVTVTYIGNLVYANHGINYLLEAARIACLQNPHINFYLVGQPRNAPNFYQKELIGLEDNVRFMTLSDPSQLNEVLEQSDILAHTRIYSLDNLSVQSKMAVYMAAGKPIVATDFADYKFLIQEQGCGYAISLDAKRIAEAILKLADNPDLRIRMGEQSRKTALEYFNLETNINRYVNVLKSIS